jgi:hypothetical protein
MNIVRQVFQRGLEIRMRDDGKWYFQSVANSGDPAPVDPATITHSFGVRPVLVTERLSNDAERTYLLHADGVRLFGLELSGLKERGPAQYPWFYHAVDLTYVLGAVAYHCERLAELYADVCRRFAWIARVAGLAEDFALFQDLPGVWYEFDALITAARRSYDSARYPLWRAFGNQKGSVPSSFEDALRLCQRVPEGLRSRLEESRSKFYVRLTEYRDCIQHYIPLYFGLSSVHMERLQGGAWVMRALIPDNPETRSRAKFTYNCKTDALTFGWDLTNEVLDVALAIMDALPRNGEGQG